MISLKAVSMEITEDLKIKIILMKIARILMIWRNWPGSKVIKLKIMYQIE